ncbi:tRNA (adenosine(37)-N6)-threonylcarbamoyltransferase complex dimerization subunit type 1 TsaB [Brevibacillus sp. SYSU BS000544]|uniref:tRNA (adenosine(37)-N6)-threonylcarbamoyltransferase complex dimerization subunit type 1 TsaB n=1 Tax=Brevibacillus sp. SYSU BS000544 TaxID=3416443 RepID=UPI003CE53B6D
MRILAIDTSNLVLSIALLDDLRVLGEWTTNLNKNHSIRMMDSISMLLDELDVEPGQLDAIAVAQGPGSYTGVRIGVSTAKTLAWSLSIPVVGVSSLQAVAMNALGYEGPIIPLFDARRGQVYTGLFRSKEMTTVEAELPERIILLRDWLPMVIDQAEGKPILFVGDDVRLHRETIQEMVGEQARFAPVSFNHPRAAHIAIVGAERIAQAENVHELVPEYLQVAEAEAKWLANQGK